MPMLSRSSVMSFGGGSETTRAEGVRWGCFVFPPHRVSMSLAMERMLLNRLITVGRRAIMSAIVKGAQVYLSNIIVAEAEFKISTIMPKDNGSASIYICYRSP